RDGQGSWLGGHLEPGVFPVGGSGNRATRPGPGVVGDPELVAAVVAVEFVESIAEAFLLLPDRPIVVVPGLTTGTALTVDLLAESMLQTVTPAVQREAFVSVDEFIDFFRERFTRVGFERAILDRVAHGRTIFLRTPQAGGAKRNRTDG